MDLKHGGGIPVSRQRNLVETLGGRGRVGSVVLRATTPALTSPCSAFCMTSTEFANASIEKISLCTRTFFGALLASRSVGDRLTRSTRTIEPLTVISSIPSV